MSVPPEQMGFLGRIGGALQRGVGGLGGALFPTDPSLDPQMAAELQRNALIQLGLGTLAGAQGGGTLGGSLLGGFQQAQNSLAGAQRQAFQGRQVKNQEEREDRLEKQQGERIKLEQQGAEAKAREQKATIAQRVAAGIGNAGKDPLAYYGVISRTPEFQSLAQEYGFDPASITTPEQVLELGSQLGALGEVGAAPPPKDNGEPLEIVDVDGVPTYKVRSQAAGQKAFRQPPGGVNVNVNNNPSGEERKGATLAVRLEGALQGLQKIAEVDPAALTPTLPEKAVGSVTEVGANALRSPMRQQAAAAQLDALDAALTLSTGAAYTREQLEGLRNSYFPQLNDDPATVASKQQRFEALVNSAYIAAGRAAPQVGEALKPRTNGAPPKLSPNPDGSYTYTP